jgi:hypothetical protein
VARACLSFQDVFIAAEGEDGDLGFGFEVHDPVEGDSGAGVLADLAYAVDLLAAAAGGDYLGDQEQVAGIVGAGFPADCGVVRGNGCPSAGVLSPQLSERPRICCTPPPRSSDLRP